MQGALFSHHNLSTNITSALLSDTMLVMWQTVIFLQGRGSWGIVLFKLAPYTFREGWLLRPRLELNYSCCTDLSKTEVASSPAFLPARMSDHRRASFLGTSQLKWLRASKALFRHLVELFQKITIFRRKLKKFFRETEHVKWNATLIKLCLEKRKTISTFIRCCLYTTHNWSFCYC